jgi:hypothetical protein
VLKKKSTGYSIDFAVSFTILAINLVMLGIMLTNNTFFNPFPMWERAINRGLLFGNLALAILSFHWIYCKRNKLQGINKRKSKSKKRYQRDDKI